MLVIDRFENDFAVVETDTGMITLPKSDIPNEAKEGDVLSIILNSEDTSGRKEKINEMANRLFKD